MFKYLFIKVIRGHSRKGTTGEASGLPFIAGALNCSVWLKYGLLINDTPMTYVNTIGKNYALKNRTISRKMLALFLGCFS